MTTFFNHQKIEKKWQKKWEKSDLNKAGREKGKKMYILDMFPYPSSDGLHVGHPESYTATDIISRYYRFKGYNVLHPIGFDSFGLPAENFAIKKGVHPQVKTQENIVNFRRQIKSLGFSYDWSREVDTSSPEYYKWTQWLFLKLFEKGLAYKKKAPVNWCDSCKTVLANEQVVDGKCERCENEVIQKDLEQWFFKVTDYADELLNKIDELDWSEALKSTQKNWIGKSEGALIKFAVVIPPACRQGREGENRPIESNGKDSIATLQSDNSIEVFTTRPDTLYGATYIVLAPEHEIIHNLKSMIHNWDEVEKYIQKSKSKTQMERTDLSKKKSGVELKGIKVINPANKKEIPVWIADYVLTGYGTGAIMAVPAHDQRDFEFASINNISIKYVIEPNSIEDIKNNHFPDDMIAQRDGESYDEAEKRYLEKVFESMKQGGGYGFTGEGKMINSDKFNGLSSAEAKDKITKFVKGEKKIQYKIRDWLVSRQRYWGAPIPIIYCDKCGAVPVPEKDLPVKLPEDVDFKPTGESPLKSSKTFHKVKCPKCGGQARRESDTMDTFVCSSWYFLRYCDAKNEKEAFSKKSLKYWMPIDLYIGGMEHAVGHLIYSRFIVKALRDMGYLSFDEPFLKMRNQGIILAEDGRKMSKRWGNVINPDEVVEEYGADTLRMYEMFMGPLEDSKPWSSKGIIGIRRFLEKVRDRANDLYSPAMIEKDEENYKKLNILINKTIKKVTEDIENIRFNTAISSLMIFINESRNLHCVDFKKEQRIFESFLIMLSPFAPHICEELWSGFSKNYNNKKYKDSIFKQEWPEFDKKLVVDDEVTIVIQVNGKVRESIKTERGTSEADIKKKVIDLPNVKKHLEGKKIKKVIYIKDKLINLVV